ASSLDQIGPFAHTVADAALLLGVMSGHDPLDSTSANVPVPDYAAALAMPVERGLRIGLAKQYLSDSNDPTMAKTVDTAVAAFKFGEKTDNPLEMYLNDVYTVNANLAGIPGISIPGGFAEVEGRKLPLGLQLLGNVFDEARLLRIAQFLERSLGVTSARPPL